MVNKTLVFIFLVIGQVATSQELIDSTIVHMEAMIYFDNDESILTEGDKPEILKLLSSTAKYSDYKLWVDAHTDDVGSEEYNLTLSEKRKQSVVDFLLSQNVPTNLIQSDFHGESKRISLKQNDESRKLNRRVSLQLITKKQFLYLKGNIFDEESKEGITAQIQLKSADFISEAKSDSSGEFKILAPNNSIVSIDITAKDYFIATNNLKITEKHRDIKLKVPLPRIEIGKVFNFKNMLFFGDRSIMLPSSHHVLEHLKRFMFLNNEQCIEIAGHINLPNEGKVDTNTHNYRLSVARALEVHDALHAIGVDTARILARGYGNWEMVYPFASTESQMKFNRRVEIIISDCDSTRLIQNHEIPNREEFNFVAPLHRYYSEDNLQSDIQSFPTKTQIDLLEHIKKMKNAQIDPSQYTYRELILALRKEQRSN
jgi:outer membrane protein OmpA-like peptidoglycan-associated protein